MTGVNDRRMPHLAPQHDREDARLAGEIDPQQVPEKAQAGAFLLDVREPSEWVDGHIEGATLIPLGHLAARIAEVPTDREIICICRSGARSGRAQSALEASGHFGKSYNMAGGMLRWIQRGLPVKKGR